MPRADDTIRDAHTLEAIAQDAHPLRRLGRRGGQALLILATFAALLWLRRLLIGAW